MFGQLSSHLHNSAVLSRKEKSRAQTSSTFGFEFFLKGLNILIGSLKSKNNTMETPIVHEILNNDFEKKNDNFVITAKWTQLPFLMEQMRLEIF